MKTRWVNGQIAPVEIESHDTLGICLHLQPNAFITWENAVSLVQNSLECSRLLTAPQVWPNKDYLVARGIVCTPSVSKPFQVALTGPLGKPFEPHDTETCATTYSPQDEDVANPITGVSILLTLNILQFN